MIELATDASPADTDLSETDILDCFNDTAVLDGQRNYLLGVGRAIEAKVLRQQALLRACHLSGQMSAAQSVEHFGRPNIRAARANAGY